MGWPEFQKCCWCLSLTTGTVVIGCWTIIFYLYVLGCTWVGQCLICISRQTRIRYVQLLVTVHLIIIGLIAFSLHTLYITFLIQQAQSDPDEWIPILEYFLAGFAMILDLLYSVLGVMLIIFNKTAKYLGRMVFYMIIVCLTYLFVVLIGISTDTRFEHFIITVFILLDGYFILILRSNQMQLEGRLTNPVDVRRRRLERERSTAIDTNHNNILSLPPPYEEAVRYGALHRSDICVTITPTEEIPNADLIEPNLMTNIPEETQPVATSSTNENVKKDSPKEPECVIYDERQYTAISNAQVVERTVVNNETDKVIRTGI